MSNYLDPAVLKTELAKIRSEGPEQPVEWIHDVLGSELSGMSNPVEVQNVVDHIGRASRALRQQQLMAMLEITTRFPEMAAKSLAKMDQLRGSADADLQNELDAIENSRTVEQ